MFLFLSRKFRQRLRKLGRVGKPRTRRALFEQFEDRRVLAGAETDFYSMSVNQSVSVEGLGTWSNDTYNST